jgi:hypothetical protein
MPAKYEGVGAWYPLSRAQRLIMPATSAETTYGLFASLSIEKNSTDIVWVMRDQGATQ